MQKKEIISTKPITPGWFNLSNYSFIRSEWKEPYVITKPKVITLFKVTVTHRDFPTAWPSISHFRTRDDAQDYIDAYSPNQFFIMKIEQTTGYQAFKISFSAQDLSDIYSKRLSRKHSRQIELLPSRKHLNQTVRILDDVFIFDDEDVTF